MDIRYGRIRFITAGLVTFLLSFSVFGQSSQAEAVKTRILDVSITPEAVGVGDQVLVSFEVPFQLTDSSLITETPGEKLPGLYLVKGPYRNYLYDHNEDDTYSIRTRVRYYYASRQIGIREIPTYEFTDPEGITYRSLPGLVRIGEYHRRVLTFPLEVSWEYSNDTVYVGETLPLLLMVENQEDISLIENVSVTAPRGVFFEKAEGLEDIRRFQVAGKTLYHLPAAVYMFIAPSPGRYFIPKASVEAGGSEGVSQTIGIDVIPLPNRVSSTGAVGSFKRTAKFSSSDMFVGSEASLEISIEGKGNLPFLTLPAPQTDSLVLSEAKEDLDIKADLNGYEGVRIFRFTFTPEEEGPIRVRIPEFPYFSEESREVTVLEARTLSASVKPALVKEEPGELEKLDALTPFSAEEVEKSQAWNLFRMPSTYMAFIPLPLGFVILLILRKRSGLLGLFSLVFLLSAGEGFSPSLDEAYIRWNAGEYPQSGLAFAAAAEDFPGNGALFYNMALCKVQTAEYADALYLARKAKHLRPSDPLIGQLPGLIEGRLQMVHQVEVPVYFNPDYAFLGLIIGVNALAAIGILLLFRKNIILTITAVLFGSFILIAGAVEIQALSAASMNIGTVNTTIPLKRIPKEGAEDWLIIEAGTGVRILEDADGFYFVENGLGTRGWIPGNAVFAHKDASVWRSDGFWENP